MPQSHPGYSGSLKPGYGVYMINVGEYKTTLRTGSAHINIFTVCTACKEDDALFVSVSAVL